MSPLEVETPSLAGAIGCCHLNADGLTEPLECVRGKGRKHEKCEKPKF